MIKTSSVTLLVIFTLIVSCATAQKNNENTIPFGFDWEFALNDHHGAEQPVISGFYHNTFGGFLVGALAFVQ